MVNGKSYIGQSVHIERRFTEHCGSNVNSYIHNAIKKYGKDNFIFEVIEECKPEELDERERYWIAFYDTVKPNGYNLTAGNDPDLIQTRKTAIPVAAIISDLQNTILTMVEIGRKYNVHSSVVSRINLGHTHYQNTITYPIRKDKPPKSSQKETRQRQPRHVCKCCGIKINSRSERCKACENLNRRVPLDEMPVTREELKTLIRTTPFTTIGRQFGVSDNAIRKWCDKYSLPRKSTEIKKISDQDWRDI